VSTHDGDAGTSRHTPTAGGAPALAHRPGRRQERGNGRWPRCGRAGSRRAPPGAGAPRADLWPPWCAWRPIRAGDPAGAPTRPDLSGDAPAPPGCVARPRRRRPPCPRRARAAGCVDSSRSCRNETTHPPRTRPGVSTHPGHAGTKRHTHHGPGRVCRLMTAIPGRVYTPDRRWRAAAHPPARPKPERGQTPAGAPDTPPAAAAPAETARALPHGREERTAKTAPTPPDQRPFRPQHTPPPPKPARSEPGRHHRTGPGPPAAGHATANRPDRRPGAHTHPQAGAASAAACAAGRTSARSRPPHTTAPNAKMPAAHQQPVW